MKLTQTKTPISGSVATYFPVGKHAGFKLYGAEQWAREAMMAQNAAAKHGLAPKAYAVVESPLGWGFLTEAVDAVVKYDYDNLEQTIRFHNSPVLSRQQKMKVRIRIERKPQVRELLRKLENTGMYRWDDHSGNMGYLRRLKSWVFIDFDTVNE